LNHTEELEIDINETKPPTEKELARELSKAKSTARQLNAHDIVQNLDALETQLELEGGDADGKMKIQDGLRKELLKLDAAEKTAEWPTVEQELKDAFYDLEDLVNKIKEDGLDREVKMDLVEAHLTDYKSSVEHIIQEKNTKEAKHLINEMGALNYSLRNAVTDGGVDVQFLKYVDEDFDTYHWKDRNKARQLINQGLQQATAGNTSAVSPILRQVYALMPEDERPGGDLLG
jgi:molecular chaperone DnaK